MTSVVPFVVTLVRRLSKGVLCKTVRVAALIKYPNNQFCRSFVGDNKRRSLNGELGGLTRLSLNTL